MMKDVHCISQLSAFVDRELPKEEQREIAEHLLICAECRLEHDRLKFAAGLASHLEHRDAPPSVWTAVEIGLDGKTHNPHGSRRTWVRFPVLAGFAGAAVFLCAFGFLAYFALFTGEPFQANLPANSSGLPPRTAGSVEPVDPNAVPANSVIALDPVNANSNIAVTAPAANAPQLPQRQYFEFETLAGAPKVGSRSTATNLVVGDVLETDAVSKARIEIADIGNVEILPNSKVKLVGTNPKQHRLALDRGSLHAKISAPPRLFFVDTPSATAVDLGCEYTLEVDEKGSSSLHVTSGFVAMERDGREAIVPAGAMCLTRRGKGLGTPFSADTSPAFRRALEHFDFGGGGSQAIDEMLTNKNFYDIISLWHLLSRVKRDDRERVFEALVQYVRLPPEVTKDGIIALNRKMLEAWREEVERAWFE